MRVGLQLTGCRKGILRYAFSLIELLAVISIITMLIAVVLPVLKAAKERARSVYCLNNLRQMTQAAYRYAADNRLYFPLAYKTERVGQRRYYYAWDFTTWKDWSANPPVDKVEPGLLWQGDTIEKVHQCPNYMQGHNWLADPYTGYNYNTSYIGMDETVWPNNSARTTELQHPAMTALFGDGEYVGGANKFMRAPFPNPRDASFSGRYAGTQGYRHLGRTNVAFADGHSRPVDVLFTNTDTNGAQILRIYNEKNKTKLGFLSQDNRAYSLKK